MEYCQVSPTSKLLTVIVLLLVMPSLFDEPVSMKKVFVFSSSSPSSLPSPDLSCLVSLPTEDGGLYHIVADASFALEDGTQIVYFYGEQSIVSTE
jgi:hypothetical protein